MGYWSQVRRFKELKASVWAGDFTVLFYFSEPGKLLCQVDGVYFGLLLLQL